MLEEVQSRHKTSKNDCALKEEILYILNKAYPKNVFKDIEEFKFYATNSSDFPYYDSNNHQIFNMNDVMQYANEKSLLDDDIDRAKNAALVNQHFIMDIPISWLISAIKKLHIRDTISVPYLKNLLRDEWRYKKSKYNSEERKELLHRL